VWAAAMAAMSAAHWVERLAAAKVAHLADTTVVLLAVASVEH
jgi:hypothetical protein